MINKQASFTVISDEHNQNLAGKRKPKMTIGRRDVSWDFHEEVRATFPSKSDRQAFKRRVREKVTLERPM